MASTNKILANGGILICLLPKDKCEVVAFQPESVEHGALASSRMVSAKTS